METAFIKGIIPPIVTPVDGEEKVVEKVLREIVDHVIAGGVHGILSLGSNGEFFGLAPEEQQRAVTITVDQAKDRVPVYMGIAAISTKECRRQAGLAGQYGVQAITVLPPMFLSPSDDELYDHFTAIAGETELPVLLYNNPDRMCCGISAPLIERLAAVSNIVGVKDSSGDLTLTAEYLRRTRGTDFKVFAGRDIMILGTLAYGGVGAVASSANVVPQLVVEIYEKFSQNDLPGALAAQFKLAPMRMAYGLGSFPVVTKDYMRLLGFDVGEPIRPNTTCKPEKMDRLKELLHELGARKLV